LASVEPKPQGWSERYGAVFAEQDVVDHYHLRPAYPEETIGVLAGLARGGMVLDLGCGPGELARRLAQRVERVDAVDVSAPMIERGRALPGGDAPNLRWLLGRVEQVVLAGPYALALAGDSIHWFDWDVALPRVAELLDPEGVLAIVRRDWLRDERLRGLLAPVYARHSWNDEFESLDPVTELERRGLFVRSGEHAAAPCPWRPTLDEIVDVHYSTSGFALSRLSDREQFERETRQLVEETLEPRDGRYDLDVVATVVWGRPGSG
jgi:SAM-dependent methyltransferase